MLRMLKVRPGSPADRAGLVAGDRIISVDGRPVGDVIDFTFRTAGENSVVIVESPAGRRRTVRLTAQEQGDLGVEFPPLTIRRCANRCIFCFVDQMPRGCRKSLYVKDDDFRASFLYGNYITLSSLSDSDRERIIAQRLSPLYLSVHATDRVLRSFMLGNERAPDILDEIRKLAAGGITVHSQVVLCPGINDGPALDRTILDLSDLFPAVTSIAVVPVGLTSHRKGLYPLRRVTQAEARRTIEAVQKHGSRFRKKFGTRLVFASDELYLRARVPVPPSSFYEDFPQIENGVGMVSSFLRDAGRVRLPSWLPRKRVTLVTGASFKDVLAPLLKRLNGIRGLKCRMIPVRNRFFGPSVTVAGLLTGRDILRELAGKRLGEAVLIPAGALKEEEPVFLDDLSLNDLSGKLSVPVIPVERFSDVVRVITEGRA